MKKNLFRAVFITALLSVLSSCNDALDLDKTLKFTTLSVEEQKAKIEESGKGLSDAVTELNSTEAGKALGGLMSLTFNPSFAPFMDLKADLEKNNPQFASNFNKALRAPIKDGEPIWGKHEWNAKNKEWDFTSSDEMTLTILFPDTTSTTSNNCEIKVTYTESKYYIEDNMNPDIVSFAKLPSAITVVMKVDGAIAMETEFSAKYDADGIPTEMKESMDIDAYNWTSEVK